MFGCKASCLLLGSVLLCLFLDSVTASFGTECFISSGKMDIMGAHSRITLRGSNSRTRQRTAPTMSFPDLAGDFRKGDKVQVAVSDVIFFHVAPKENPDGFKVPQGLEGIAPFV